MEVHSSPKASEDANGEIVGRKRKSLVCPYLDTIQRSVLDFDLEPSCSITLQTGAHIYACLVCGKYFRGRGRQTPAYTHAVEEAHFVFIHLLNGTFHCLPDDYEIENDNDASLDDIRAALHPRFTASQIRTLDEQATLSRDLFGRRYLPGFVGLNNLSKTDGINAVVQALAHVPPLRDYYLRQDTNTHTVVHHKHRQAKHVNDCFGQLVRKLWSDRRFKNHVDPHQLVQAVAVASKKRFQVGQQVEAGEFVAWFLHQLHIGTGGTKKAGSSIIHELFQGRVEVTNREAARPSNNKSKISVGTDDNDDDRVGSDDDGGGGEDRLAKKGSNHAEQLIPEVTETTSDTNFLQLTLDIPEKPLFRDEDGGLVIPQEPLSNILKKFDGITFLDAVSQSGHAQRKRYRLLQLPNYLILHLARFKTNRYNREKNPTIVMFPVRNLDLSEYVHHSSTDKEKPPTEEQVRGMTVKELRDFLVKYGQEHLLIGAIEGDELRHLVIDFVVKTLPDLLTDKYDLVANITHQSPADVGREGKHDPLQEGSYKCHVQHRGTKQWYEIQDLHVQEIMPQQIGLSESYVLIFERKSAFRINRKL